MLIALQEKHYGYPLFRCMKSSVFHARSEGVVMAADSGQKNIQIVGTASMNTYDVALRVGKTKQLVCNGCIALCGEISDKVFGKYAPVTKHSNFSRIKAGDHIRIGNEHSVMVLQKNGNMLTVVEGNYNATVHWGRKITKKELQESGFYVETRY